MHMQDRKQERGHGPHGRGHGPMGRNIAMMMAAVGSGRGGGRGRWDGDDDGGLGGGGWGGRGRHGRGPGGRRGRMFASGELRLVLLRLIADQSRHGYELIKAIEELTGGEYAPSPGVVYPTLSLLVDEGRIAEADGDGPRKAFTATDEGFAELADRDAEAKALVGRLQALANREQPESPPIRRATANLFTALRQRAAAGDLDKETALQIADILDEAARRIERL
jgi:DNA-binding PadR family transcriptional regulator